MPALFAEGIYLTNKIFWEYFLESPVLRLVAIPKSIYKIVEKQLKRDPFLR